MIESFGRFPPAEFDGPGAAGEGLITRAAGRGKATSFDRVEQATPVADKPSVPSDGELECGKRANGR